ncbi:hypothetical protein CIHG_04026 [Coccidioides immitis H538.4]|uniref:Casein kinase substrate phosphoprotein PP28 domain-containing protein n=1 Tax=Coccidioides immitis H538.4 TaxID=396776 RepID=A0A0J8UFS9_COCIT|nr:hypothetical protein CIHG_04026 [Coccidioides immitis H538.4]
MAAEGSTLNSGAAHPQKPKRKSKSKVADSWEDESVSSEPSEDEKDEKATNATSSPQGQTYHSDVPSFAASSTPQWSSPDPRNPHSDSPRRRPEKQTAVASRIISSALGVRAKRTEEQKAYDRAMFENERRKRERERELARQRREDEEKAKQAVWES